MQSVAGSARSRSRTFTHRLTKAPLEPPTPSPISGASGQPEKSHRNVAGSLPRAAKRDGLTDSGDRPQLWRRTGRCLERISPFPEEPSVSPSLCHSQVGNTAISDLRACMEEIRASKSTSRSLVSAISSSCWTTRIASFRSVVLRIGCAYELDMPTSLPLTQAKRASLTTRTSTLFRNIRFAITRRQEMRDCGPCGGGGPRRSRLSLLK